MSVTVEEVDSLLRQTEAEIELIQKDIPFSGHYMLCPHGHGPLEKGEKLVNADPQERAEEMQRRANATWDLWSSPHVSTSKQCLVVDFDPTEPLSIVRKEHGKALASLGVRTKNGVQLYPEELLYLIERGIVLIRLSKGCENENTLYSMSINQAYGWYAQHGGWEAYLVYSHLKRCSISVFRSKTTPHYSSEGHMVFQSHPQGASGPPKTIARQPVLVVGAKDPVRVGEWQEIMGANEADTLLVGIVGNCGTMGFIHIQEEIILPTTSG